MSPGTFLSKAGVLAVGALFAVSLSAAHAATVLVQFGNGEAITSDDVSRHLDVRIDLRTLARTEWGMQKAVDEMTMTRALVLEGERLGEARDSSDNRFDDKYALTVYRKLSPACEKPADEIAIKRFYDEHPEAFLLPVQARLSRVMLPIAQQIDGAHAKAWLFGRAEAIASGHTSFETVAEQATAFHSLDRQGDLGWVQIPGETPLMRAIASTKQGELVGPATEGGFVYLFYVAAKRDARQLAWSEVEKQAATRAVEYCREQAQSQIRADLFKRYGVEIVQKSPREPGVGATSR